MWSFQKGETAVVEFSVRTWQGDPLDPVGAEVEVVSPRGERYGSGGANPIVRVREGQYEWGFPVPVEGPDGKWRVRLRVTYGPSGDRVAVLRDSFWVEG